MKFLKVILIFALSSCNMSDSVEELTGGYVFYHESRQNNTISNQHGNELIPNNVTAYGTNDEFIIVKQIQLRSISDHQRYPSDDSVFYWIISHRKHLFLGPLTKEQYENQKQELKVPETLQLKGTGY